MRSTAPANSSAHSRRCWPPATDLDILCVSPCVFGPAPSNATVSRFFERTVANSELFAYGFENRRKAQPRGQGDGRNRRSRPRGDPRDVAFGKGKHRRTYKRGYGFAPFIAICDYGAGDGTGEILAALLRPGNAGANSADDHIRVFDAATAQLPGTFSTPAARCLGRRSWSAPTVPVPRGNSSGTCTPAGCRSPAPIRSRWAKPDQINDKRYWQPARDQDGQDRPDAWVMNDTHVILRSGCPPGMNCFCAPYSFSYLYTLKLLIGRLQDSVDVSPAKSHPLALEVDRPVGK